MANQTAAELQRIKDLQTSIGKAMDNQIAQQDKRNKKLGEELSLVKKITDDLSDTESTAKALVALQTKRNQIAKQNFGVNEKNKKSVLAQLKGSEKMVSMRLREGQVIDEVGNTVDEVTSSMKSGFDNAASSLKEIPMIGGLMAAPFNAASSAVSTLGAVGKEVFAETFAASMAKNANFAKAFKEGHFEMMKAVKGLGKVMISGPLIGIMAIVGAIGLGLKAFVGMENSAKSFRQETGLLNSQTQGLQEQILTVARDTSQLGVGFEEASKAASAFVSEFNNVDRPSTNVLKSIAAMEQNFGVMPDQAAKLNKTFTNLGNVSTDTAQAMSQQVVELAKQNDVAPSKVIEDINNNAEEIGRMFRGNTKALTEQAVQAAKLGTSLGEALKISKGLLDYDSSINDELEASAILNTNLNFSNARALAASGNYLDAQREIVKQTQKTVDLNNLNMYEAEALEKATGMTVVQMQNLARVEEMKNKLGEDGVKALGQAIKSGEDLSKLSQEELIAKSEALAEQQEMQSSIDKMQNSFKAVGMELMAAFAPIGEAIIPMFQTLAEILAPIGSLFSWISEYTSGLGEKVSAMIGPLGVVGKILKGIASIAIIFAAYKAFASLASIPFVGAALGAIAAGAVLAAGFGFLSSIQVGDVMSPADGKTQISTKEGGLLELSSNDDVMAAPGLFDRMKSRREQRAFSRAEMNLAPLLQKMDTLIAATKGKQVLVADGRQLASTTATQQEVSLKNQFGLNSAIST